MKDIENTEMDEETIDSELILNQKYIEGLMKQLREKQQYKAQLLQKKDTLNEKKTFKSVLASIEEQALSPKLKSPSSDSESSTPEVT